MHERSKFLVFYSSCLAHLSILSAAFLRFVLLMEDSILTSCCMPTCA